jgi:hypothetical protein
MKTYPVVSADGHLAPNEVWNVPEPPVNEVRGNLKTYAYGMWTIPVSYRALAMDMHGRVFGMRTMGRARECGHNLEGRVKVGGRTYRAFTSSKLFERADGTLCDVAIVYVCGTPDMLYRDPLTLPTGEVYRAYLADITRRYHYEREGTYADLKEYARALELIADGTADACPWCEYRERAEELRARLAPVMGW